MWIKIILQIYNVAKLLIKNVVLKIYVVVILVCSVESLAMGNFDLILLDQDMRKGGNQRT